MRRLRPFPFAFATSFAVTAGFSVAYMCLRVAAEAIDNGLPADAIRELRHEWRTYSEFRTRKDSAKTDSTRPV